jgi:hypothetical protein
MTRERKRERMQALGKEMYLLSNRQRRNNNLRQNGGTVHNFFTGPFA